MQIAIAAAIAALFGFATAAPAPAPQADDVRETLTLSSFSAHKFLVAPRNSTEARVDSLSYKLTGIREEGGFGVACTAAAAEGDREIIYAPQIYNCNGDDDHDYYFSVVSVSDKDVFTLNVFREVTFGWGYQAQIEVPTYCHAGGNDSMACAQVGGNVEVPMHP
ncbi:hypothetical protein PG993_014788 [Apiospora rasikravindrae]|uniref:AA1-like domain-containing protein n=1 Tax=Apiospora rasikravindrae TaxID=990691 RepID=A0ABR1RNR6_9PEZI